MVVTTTLPCEIMPEGDKPTGWDMEEALRVEIEKNRAGKQVTEEHNPGEDTHYKVEPVLATAVTDLMRPSRIAKHMEELTLPVEAIPTPFSLWNENCRDEGGGKGLALGWHVIVAGSTGHGKSLMALNIAAKAIMDGETVAFMSLEMSTPQLASRLYAILTNTDVRLLERGTNPPPSVEHKLCEIHETTGGRFLTNLDPVYDIEKMVGQLKYWAEVDGAKLFVIDYLQLATSRTAESLYKEVSDISSQVIQFAKQNKVVTIGLSQMNRRTTGDKSTSPFNEGLIGSSSLENDSDQVLLLDHSRYERGMDRSARTYAILSKNRHGGYGDIPIEWDYRTLRVREALPDEEHLWPGNKNK